MSGVFDGLLIFDYAYQIILKVFCASNKNEPLFYWLLQ